MYFLHFTFPTVSLGTWRLKKTFVLHQFILLGWTTNYGTKYKSYLILIIQVAFHQHLSKIQSFSFTFLLTTSWAEFHHLVLFIKRQTLQLTQPPKNLSTCFSTSLTCNFPPSGISDSCNKRWKLLRSIYNAITLSLGVQKIHVNLDDYHAWGIPWLSAGNTA